MVPTNTIALEISCREVREELANYLEGDLTLQLRLRIESHLARCTGCRAYYDGIRRVVLILGKTEVIELPVGFSQRLYSRLLNL